MCNPDGATGIELRGIKIFSVWVTANGAQILKFIGLGRPFFGEIDGARIDEIVALRHRQRQPRQNYSLNLMQKHVCLTGRTCLQGAMTVTTEVAGSWEERLCALAVAHRR